MEKVRVRYAPSPTGLLHIGNARTALFNYLYAKHNNGDFVIRIEDTDVLRNVEGGEESQLRYLSWLGINPDESPNQGGKYGPYRQLQRLDIYSKYADDLLSRGLAYKEYRDDSEHFAIRFKVPKDKTFTFKDMVRGELRFESKDVEDWIIVKDNGIPTYNFAVVIDDHMMEISHVLRGEEHITNTPKQIMIYEAFEWIPPTFGHMTLIVNEHGKKLSKRDGNVMQFISQYEELGYLPNAMFNFISLLGWSSPTNEEILEPNQIIELFNDDRLSKAPSFFDQDKLRFINSKHLKKMDLEEITLFCKKFLTKANIKIKSESWLRDLVSVLRDRLTYGAEIIKLYEEFFHEDFFISDEAYQFIVENDCLNTIKALKEELIKTVFESQLIEEAIKNVGLSANVKGKLLFMPARIATTGDMHGPSLPIQLSLLGKDLVLKRINETIIRMENKQ
ncbi:glutamate--tRNA ligase [Acholeplasma sp. OttesenSCG-928-E16]|nr:glutamate--tRNA ligase [Acholeplasma sp. OttesenSCG-928-E16]